MYSVKRESGAEICRGCLSTDRRLSPLANYDLFFTLLNDKQKLEYFSRQSGLIAHNQTVHLKVKAPKDKMCSICGRGFSDTRTLKFHMHTHTGERPHACPQCPAAFTQPYPLRKHLETQHGEVLPKHRQAPKIQRQAPVTLALGSGGPVTPALGS